MTDKLLPCPFCGSMPYIESDRDIHKLKGTCPDSCMFNVDDTDICQVFASEKDLAMMIRDWNSRYNLHDTDTLRGALRLILPLAKGYVTFHKVGKNQNYIETAEKALNSYTPSIPYAVQLERVARAIYDSRGYFMPGDWQGMIDRFIGDDKRNNCWKSVYSECFREAKAALEAMGVKEGE